MQLAAARLLRRLVPTRKQILVVAIFFLLSFAALVVFGEPISMPDGAMMDDGGVTTPQYPDPRDSRSLAGAAIEQVQKLVGDIEAQITRIGRGGLFSALGKKILAVLGVIVVSWSVLKNMMLKPGLTQIVADLVFPFVIIALGLAALDQNLAKLISDSVEGLSSALASGGPAGGMTSSQMFTKNMLSTISQVWSISPPAKMTDLYMSYLAALLLQLVAVAFLIAATAIGLGVLFMAKFQVALAIALAPVMIPWLLWKPTEFLFSGWLTFLLKGGFISVGVFAMEGAIRNGFTGIQSIATQSHAGIDSAMAYGAVAVMAMLFAFLLLKGAEIGSGVISGAVSGFGGFQAVTGGGTAAALKGMARGAAGTVSGAGSLGKAHQLGKSVAGKSDRDLTQLQKSMQPRQGTIQRMAYELGRKTGPDRAPLASMPNPGSAGPNSNGGSGAFSQMNSSLQGRAPRQTSPSMDAFTSMASSLGSGRSRN